MQDRVNPSVRKNIGNKMSSPPPQPHLPSPTLEPTAEVQFPETLTGSLLGAMVKANRARPQQMRAKVASKLEN